jgi:hypothetical protein
MPPDGQPHGADRSTMGLRDQTRRLSVSRCPSGGGHDWSKQLPAIVDAMHALPVRSMALDGEGVICGSDGKSDFDRMRACFNRRARPMPSCIRSTCWSLMVATCATSPGRAGAGS